MKILNLSIAQSILDKNSKDAQRMVEYGRLAEKYIIIVPSKKRQKVQLAENVIAYGTGCFTKPTQLVRMMILAGSIIKKEGIDAITTQDPFELGKVGWLLSRARKIGLNVQLHGDFFSNKYWRQESLRNRFRYYLGLFIVRRADSIRVVSQRVEDDLVKRGIRGDKIFRAPIYTEKKETRENILREIHPGKFIFLNISRLSQEKNLALLLSAFARVAEQATDAILILAGEGKEKQKLVSLAEKLKVRNKVFFPGWVDETSDYLSSADVFVLSSNYEGWSRVIIEAAMAKLPIVMTDVGCAGEVIRDKESGLVAPVSDQEALAKAMLEMYANKALGKGLADNAVAEVEKLPNKEQTFDLYKKSFEKAKKKL